MNREMIIKGLTEKGYKAEKQESLKNGVVFKGIRIDNGSEISPVIYTDEIIERANGDIEKVVSEVIRVYKENKNPQIEISMLFDREFVLTHLYIGIQKESNENIEKGNCDLVGLESYLYIKNQIEDKTEYAIKVSSDYLKKAGISSQEAWENAEFNTCEDTVIESLAKIMANMMGEEYDPCMDEVMSMYVITNHSRIKGASAILDHDALLLFAQDHNTNKILVMPSSIHEMLISPWDDSMDFEQFSDMVKEVNSTQVAEEERLTDRAYIIEL